MSENPLAGLRIPSVEDIAVRVVEFMGIQTIDFANPLQRERFRKQLQQMIGLALDQDFERSLQAATERAVGHVFRVMRDPEYQAKTRKHREASRKKRAERRAKEQESEREARMDYSKKNMAVTKATLQ